MLPPGTRFSKAQLSRHISAAAAEVARFLFHVFLVIFLGLTIFRV
jgi:Protein of unknown function (DUF1328)